MLEKSLASVALCLGLVTVPACAPAAPLSGEDETNGGQRSSTPSTAGMGNPGASGAPGAAGSVAVGGGSNGSSAGSSGTASGGSSTGDGAGAAATTPFGQVTALLGKRCAGSKCHSSSATQLAFATAAGSALHSLLTTPIPAGIPHCVGVTLVTPNDTNSPLLKIVMSGGKIACTKPKTENVGPMPDKCTTTSTSVTGVCLTAAEIKLISDWISAGAPQG